MERALARRFGAFYFIFFMPVGMQAPYLFLFFERRGFSDSQLGTLGAVTPLMTVLTPPLWGALADRWGDRRWTLAGLLLAGGLVFPWLMWAESFAAALALMVAFSCFAFAGAPITDAIALESIEREGGEYGRLRLWGSLGFAAPLLLAGLVLERGAGAGAASLYPMFVGFTVLRLASVGMVWALPASGGGKVGRRFDWRAARVFATPRFLALALCAVLAMGAMASYYLYFSIYLDQRGIPDHLKGYFWVIAVGAEVAMMWVVGAVIRRLGVKRTFVLSVLACAVRLLAYSFPLGPVGIAAAQCLHSLTFTAFMVSGITFVNRLAPPELRASGQSLWAAISHGLGSAVGAKLAGVAAGALGLPGMFRLFAAVAAGAAVLAIILVRADGEGG